MNSPFNNEHIILSNCNTEFHFTFHFRKQDAVDPTNAQGKREECQERDQAGQRQEDKQNGRRLSRQP